jgi:ubiquinone/menaquinone biosynthesis C-methylase UbiE
MFDHFNLLAPIYDRVISPPDHQRLKELLRLPSDGSMLDAGGGTGRVSQQLRPLVGQLILTDLSAGMLRQAGQKEQFLLSMAHAEQLPFADESFDRVLVVDALHHFCDQRQALADLLRVLKPGGRLLIEEPDLNHFRVRLIALMEKLALMRSHFYRPEAIGQMIADHGLSPHIVRNGQMTAWIMVDK